MIDPDIFNQLLTPVACGVSIYLPIDPSQRDQRAPDARLRALIDSASKRLEGCVADATSRERLVGALRRFGDSADFARHRDPGLAIFAGPAEDPDNVLQVVPLPHTPDETVTVGSDFHIKPLLPLMAANQRFNILALSKAKVRLMAATPFAWEEVPLEVLPIEVQAEMDSRAEAATDPGEKPPEAVRSELLVASPRNIATAVRAAVVNDPAPIVLVADPHVAGAFLQQVEIKQVLPQPVHLNPFALSDPELHEKVLGVIRPMLDVDLDAALDLANARLGTGEPTVAIRLEEILMAGREGRIDTVVVAEDEPLWGHLNPEGGVVAHGTPNRDDEDLLNLAAVLALRNGGRAFAVPRARLPRQVPAVATLRF